MGSRKVYSGHMGDSELPNQLLTDVRARTTMPGAVVVAVLAFSISAVNAPPHQPQGTSPANPCDRFSAEFNPSKRLLIRATILGRLASHKLDKRKPRNPVAGLKERDHGDSTWPTLLRTQIVGGCTHGHFIGLCRSPCGCDVDHIQLSERIRRCRPRLAAGDLRDRTRIERVCYCLHWRTVLDIR